MRLRTRAAALVLLAVLPSLALIVYSAFVARGDAIRDAEDKALDIVDTITLTQGHLIAGARQILLGFSGTPPVQAHDGEACSTFARAVASRAPWYTNVAAARADGSAFCSAVPLPGPVSYADREWFPRALDSRDVVLGRYVIGRLTGKPTLALAYAARDASGAPRAVLFLGLDLSWINATLASQRLPPDTIVTIIDGDGVVLARHPGGNQWTGRSTTGSPLFETLRRRVGQGTTRARGLEGAQRLIAFTPLHMGPAGPGAWVTASIPERVVFATANRLLAWNLGALGLVAALALAAALAGSRRWIDRPVRVLLDVTSRVGAGEAGVRSGPPYPTGDLGELGRAFDEMAATVESREGAMAQAREALRQGNAQLEARVAERTADLDATNQRLRAEIAERTAAQERFAVMVEGTAQGMIVVDAEGRIRLVNGGAEALFGYRREELVGQTVDVLVPERLRGGHRGHRGLFFAVPQARQMAARRDVTGLRKDGEEASLEIGLAPISVQGEALVLASIVDITERKRAEAALRQAQEAAETANRAKSEFLSRMSHELRTPLNAILGFGQLLEVDAASVEQREGVAEILKGGRHLLGLIDEVLDITGIEAGRTRLSPEPVRVRALFAEVLDLVRPLAADREVAIEVDTDRSDDHHVWADQQRIRQVFLNLLSNAIKYNRAGGRVILGGEPVGADRMRLSVADTGPGIPEPLLARLFTPFDRLGAEQAGVEGTGLGLALSKRLVEAMEGTIGVESAPGRGSTFWVELSRVSAPESAAGALAEPPARAPGTTGAILYVEDNLANVRLLEHVLRRRPGVTLLTAMQGGMGLELARQHRPGLILLDLHLPDLPGDEVLRQLRADPRTDGIGVVMMSADASPGQVRRLLAAGARDYLTKPVDIHRLLRVIDEALGGG